MSILGFINLNTLKKINDATILDIAPINMDNTISNVFLLDFQN